MDVDYILPDDEEHAKAILEGLADCVSCETGSPSPCPTCGREDLFVDDVERPDGTIETRIRYLGYRMKDD